MDQACPLDLLIIAKILDLAGSGRQSMILSSVKPELEFELGLELLNDEEKELE